VTTQQPHIILVGYILYLNILLFTEKRWERYFASFALFFHLFAIFFCQQRALWGAAFLGSIALLLVNGKRSVFKKSWPKILLIISITLLVFVLLLIYIEGLIGSSLYLTLFSRFSILFNPSYDISMIARLSEIKLAFNQWLNTPIFGTGLGSTISRYARMGVSDIVDNSFINFLWKMGALGFLFYVGILISFFKSGFIAIRRGKDILEKNFLTAVLISFASILIVALTNSCIFIYRFNIIWAMLFAIIYSYYEKNVIKPK
jgi:hypothetical protein